MSHLNRTFQQHPESSFEELERHLQFKYLPKISFESDHDQKIIKAKGIEKLENKEIASEIQERGKRFREKIESAYIPTVSVRWISDAVDYGLFAEEDIKEGSYVGEYTGVVRENNRIYFEPLNNYCYEYPVLDEIGRSYVIDATEGSLTRFINHSYAPNLKPVYAFYEGFYHLIFIALHSIEKGAQLSYDYGKNYWYLRQPPDEL